VPNDIAAVYNTVPAGFWPRAPRYVGFDIQTGERTSKGEEDVRSLADLLDTPHLMTLPVFNLEEMAGRFFITTEKHGFCLDDIEFLHQISRHMMPVIENLRLVDRMASDAAEKERQRIASDIHDSIIQPYIGLKMGLEATRRIVPAGAAVSSNIEDLLTMTDEGIAHLRQYIGRLREEQRSENNLLDSIERFTKKYSEATGTEVEMETYMQDSINDRLAAEVFQMVVECLSNIRKHAHAGHVKIRLDLDKKCLVLAVENDDIFGEAPLSFQPRSVTGRAEMLGGSVSVEPVREGGSLVRVTIPL